MAIDRRTLMQGLAASTLLAASNRAAADAPSETIAIVDTHQHLWDLNRFRLDWLRNAPAILNRNYSVQDYDAAAAGLNIAKCVYLEVDLAVEQQTAEGKFVVELAQTPGSRTVAGVISGRCDRDTFEPYIRQFQNSSAIKGVRHLLQSQPRGQCLEEQFVQSVQLLGELGMSFDLTIRPAELGDALQLVRQCPNTLFIVDHCGVADPKAFMPAHRDQAAHDAETWKRDMHRLASEKNTVCKISGIIAHVPDKWETADLAPIVNHCVEQFGDDRVMFGGDWPVCLLGGSLKTWVTSLREIVAERPLAFQRKLFAENAVKHYRLVEG